MQGCVLQELGCCDGNTALLEAEAPDDLWYLRSQSGPAPGQLYLLAAPEIHQANCVLLFFRPLYKTRACFGTFSSIADAAEEPITVAYHSAEHTLQLASTPVRLLY